MNSSYVCYVEKYSAYLAEIKAESPRVFSLNLERQTFIKVQFLYEDKRVGERMMKKEETFMLVMLHKECKSILLYVIDSVSVNIQSNFVFFFHSQTAYFTVIDSHYKDLLRRILSVQRVVLFIELLYIQYQILYEVSHTSKEIWVFSLYILINWSHTAFTRVLHLCDTIYIAVQYNPIITCLY